MLKRLSLRTFTRSVRREIAVFHPGWSALRSGLHSLHHGHPQGQDQASQDELVHLGYHGHHPLRWHASQACGQWTDRRRHLWRLDRVLPGSEARRWWLDQGGQSLSGRDHSRLTALEDQRWCHCRHRYQSLLWPARIRANIRFNVEGSESWKQTGLDHLLGILPLCPPSSAELDASRCWPADRVHDHRNHCGLNPLPEAATLTPSSGRDERTLSSRPPKLLN